MRQRLVTVGLTWENGWTTENAPAVRQHPGAGQSVKETDVPSMQHLPALRQVA